MNHDAAIAVGTAHIAALRQIEQLRIELDEARLERDTEQAFRHKANSRVVEAAKEVDRLSTLLQRCHDGFSAFIHGRKLARPKRDALLCEIRDALPRAGAQS